MRYFDDFGNELLENEIDLTCGYLTTGTVIKVDAAPIDNVDKFAWADDDYEEAQFYHLFPEETEQPSNEYEARIAALEEELAAAKILLGVE